MVYDTLKKDVAYKVVESPEFSSLWTSDNVRCSLSEAVSALLASRSSEDSSCLADARSLSERRLFVAEDGPPAKGSGILS